MRMLFAVAPGYGLMLPVVPLIWAARVAGHEVLVASTAEMVRVGANAGLPMYDVLPDRDVWDELMRAINSKNDPDGDGADTVSEEFRLAARAGNPFGLFTLTMTEGTVAGGRDFGADLVVHTSDHAVGPLAALALGVPALDVGNRVSWSMRDVDFRTGRDALRDDEVVGWSGPSCPSPTGGRARWPGSTEGAEHGRPGRRGTGRPRRRALVGHALRALQRRRLGAGLGPAPAGPPPRVCHLGTVVPAMRGTSSLAVVLEALAGWTWRSCWRPAPQTCRRWGSCPPRALGRLPRPVHVPADVLVDRAPRRLRDDGNAAALRRAAAGAAVVRGQPDVRRAGGRAGRRTVPRSGHRHRIGSPGLAERLLGEPSFAAAAAR